MELERSNDVIGLGNTIVDLLIKVDDSHLMELDLNKGEFHLVDEDKAKSLLQKISHKDLSIEVVPGGSSANTLKGIALFGGNAILCGKVGNDEHGDLYIQEMNNLGVNSRINKGSLITGNAITFITPDAERTFSVHLGSAIELEKEEILEEDIKKSKVLHLEGYQVEGPTKETIIHAVQLAKKHNTLVSIDLADPGVIRRNKDFLMKLIDEYADIVFVNEVEAKEITGLENEAAALELAKKAKFAIVKIGKEGSFICNNEEVVKVNPYLVNAVDTTGAGDSYAAGFLYGLCNNWDLKKSGQLGSLLASRVIGRVGMKLDEINKKELFQIVNAVDEL